VFNLQHARMLPANWLHAYFTALLHFVSILFRQFVALSVPGLYALYYQHLNWAEVDLQLVVLAWPALLAKLHCSNHCRCWLVLRYLARQETCRLLEERCVRNKKNNYARKCSHMFPLTNGNNYVLLNFKIYTV